MQQPGPEQIIAQAHYLKHRQKLLEIKQHSQNTSLQFYNQGKPRPVDRKGMLQAKDKQLEIQSENEQLRRKIARINGLPGADSRKASYSVTVQSAVGRRRYPEEVDNKMEVISDCGDGDNVKYYLPMTGNKIRGVSTSQSKAQDYNSVIFNLRQSEPVVPERKSGNESEPRQDSITGLELKPKIKQIIRESASAIERNQAKYTSAQKQAHRIILFKKSKIIQPMVSFLIELSLIDNQLLMVAYGMGLITQDFRLLLSRKKTKQILRECAGDYTGLWDRVTIDYQSGIKISQIDRSEDPSLNTSATRQKARTSQHKKHEITHDFLQRNYYALMKESNQKQYEPRHIKQMQTTVKLFERRKSLGSANKSRNMTFAEFTSKNTNQGIAKKLEEKPSKLKKKFEDIRKQPTPKPITPLKPEQPKKYKPGKQTFNDTKPEQIKDKDQPKHQQKLERTSNYDQSFEQLQEQQAKQAPIQSISLVSQSIPNNSQQVEESLGPDQQYLEPADELEEVEYSAQFDSNPSKVQENSSFVKNKQRPALQNNSIVESIKQGGSQNAEEYLQEEFQG